VQDGGDEQGNRADYRSEPYAVYQVQNLDGIYKDDIAGQWRRACNEIRALRITFP